MPRGFALKFELLKRISLTLNHRYLRETNEDDRLRNWSGDSTCDYVATLPRTDRRFVTRTAFVPMANRTGFLYLGEPRHKKRVVLFE